MNHAEKIEWMHRWCAKAGASLDLEGECGFGRECVGISVDGMYPDYNWYDDDWNRSDENGDVWVPDGAYHKHPCVAVLGRGEDAEDKLFDWLQWFEQNGFTVESGDVPGFVARHPIDILLGNSRFVRMVRKVREVHE